MMNRVYRVAYVALTWAVAVYVGCFIVVALSPAPKILECPGTNVHVWDLDQCDRIGHGGGFPGGGRGDAGGILGTIGKIVDGLTGGIL